MEGSASSLIAQYFLNHRLQPDEIEWQMQEFAKAGYQGVYAHARQGLLTPYMSDAWWQAIDKIVEMCRTSGMGFWIWDEDYFPSGLAGGRVIWENPGLISRQLVFTVVQAEGSGPFEVDFAPGTLLRAFALKEKPDGTFEEALDVTPFCGTRRQTWTARQVRHAAYSPLIDPVGHPHWRCSMTDNRFALSWAPPNTGMYTIVGVLVNKTEGVHPDLLRPDGVRRFIETTYEPYFQRYGSEFGKVVKGAFTDEPSPGGFGPHSLYPWSPGFAAAFQEDHGYDLLPHLAHLAVDIDERSAAVRHHYRLTQHRLQRDHYVGQLASWCDEHGILFSGHLTRTEWLSLVAAWWPNELRCYQPMHIPTADPLGASCGWAEAAAYHTGLKVASSAAHLFGRAQASSDGLAVVGDEASLRDLKYMLDYQMVLGINHFSVHGLHYSIDGPRKDEVPPSLFYQHTEWKHMPVLLDHVRQTCEILTGGEHLCELAMLYPSTSLACQGRPGVAWWSLPDEALIHALVEQLLSHQRDFDFIDEVTLQESVSDTGELTTQEPYRVILLPHLRYIDERTAEALLRFVHAGGKVVAVGAVPHALAHDLSAPQRAWADASIAHVPELDEAALEGLPGADVQGPGARDVFVLRRRNGDTVNMFVFNRRDEPFAGSVDGVTVYVSPRGSAMLVGSAGACVQQARALVAPPTQVVADWSQDWTVDFEPNHLPLSFWHVSGGDRPSSSDVDFSGTGFDLMVRETDPAGEGDGPVRYRCRFMLTGQITDARLVMEDSTIDGEWELFVNNVRIEGWQRTRVFDCRNIEAPVGSALRSGSTPTLNVITVVTSGPGRGLKEIPYLYGSFGCQYRYGHLSFPFVRGGSGSMRLAALQPWGVVGYPTFSGSAHYRREVEIPAEAGLALDLGRVEDVAAVSVDGVQAAVLAWPPYQCSLADIRAGTHDLGIEVTNPPANRNRAARLPAGLLGPVRLVRVT